MRVRRLPLVLGAVTVLLAACTSGGAPSADRTGGSPRAATATTGGSAASSAAEPGTIRTVFVVMMENTDWSSVKDSSDWAYVNSLLGTGAYAENYRSGLHPSLPNYVALEAGQTFGLTDGAYLPSDHSVHSSAHLTSQLRAAHVDWKYWAENLPGDGSTCNTSDPGTPYSLDHDAQVYFDDVRLDQKYCIAHERPYAELAPALAAGSVSGYNLIVPNDYHQGEKPAPGSKNQAAQADGWLRTQIPMLQRSEAYQDGALILILWDESSGTGAQPQGLVALGKYVKPGYSNTVAYSHASTLRTVQEIFGVRPLLGAAATATGLSDLLTIALPH